MYCKHCGDYLPSSIRTHRCKQAGLLRVDEDDSFLISAAIGLVTDSALLGGILGGDFVGGAVGDLLDGDLMD